MKFYLLFVISVILKKITTRCGIEKIFEKDGGPNRMLIEQEDEDRRLLLEDDWRPLRIHLDYSYIENNLNNTIHKHDLIDLKERIMPKTQQVFESLLKVKRIQKKLKLNAAKCEQFPIPEIYHTEGVDADVVIFVLIDTSGDFSQYGIEAAAIHCLQHQETLRPVAGYIQFKDHLSVTNSTALDYMVWLALHEVTHILVMNEMLYEDFIDSKTLLPHGTGVVTGKHETATGRKMSYIKSPNVLKKAREHFGCDDTFGVPLEYNGGAGTAGAHWAKKYMNTDYMIGDSYGENLFSDISLALFEDSGWYQVDYSMSNLFLWGKNKGCGFFNETCLHIVNNTTISRFKNEFCSTLDEDVCSVSHIFRGECLGRKYKQEISPNERYFNDPFIGGRDRMTDYCPIAIEQNGHQAYYGGSCRKGRAVNGIEKVCPECACFLSNLKPIKTNLRKSEDSIVIEADNERLQASCYEYKCEADGLYFVVNDNKYKCFESSIVIPGYAGTIICPKYEDLCHEKFSCKFGCVDKYNNSIPFLEYTYDDNN
jgi:hypothetical protein